MFCVPCFEGAGAVTLIAGSLLGYRGKVRSVGSVMVTNPAPCFDDLVTVQVLIHHQGREPPIRQRVKTSLILHDVQHFVDAPSLVTRKSILILYENG